MVQVQKFLKYFSEHKPYLVFSGVYVEFLNVIIFQFGIDTMLQYKLVLPTQYPQ